METLTQILCVMDSSDSSDDALRYAIAKAKQQHAKLTVARVVSPEEQTLAEDSAEKNQTKSWSPANEVDFEFACEELCSHGDPADDIVGLARQLEVDHIVIGTSGRHRLNRIEMGRTARRVVQDAPCAVTVVNNEDVPQ